MYVRHTAGSLLDDNYNKTGKHGGMNGATRTSLGSSCIQDVAAC